MRSIGIVVLSLSAAGLLISQPQHRAHAAEPTEYHLFLLAGQSNMAGRGEVSEIDLKPHPRVLMLDQQGTWRPAVDPLHFDKPQVVGVGPGRSFAIAYADAHPDVTVGLIPCAVGGSPIDSWQPGAYYEPTNSHPYDDAVARVMVALQSGTLKGILWHQGESDSKAGLSETYQAKLAALIERFRTEWHGPEVPFLIGQLGHFAGRPWDVHRFRIDQAHRSVAQQCTNVAFAHSRGLNHKGDEVHFDAPAARELGLRYFAAWEWLQEKQPVLTLSPGPDNPRNSEGDFIRLKNGDLRFVYTRFSAGAGDHDAALLVSRTSHDGGATWSTEDVLTLVNEGQWNVMSVSLLRLDDDRIALFYMRKDSLSDCRPLLRFSEDEGESWSAPTTIIPDDQRGYYVLNNDRALQLQPSDGASSGRIIIPVALHNLPGQAAPDWAGQITSYHSDDNGLTWHRSQTMQTAARPAGTRIMAQEPGVVELRDGRLMMWIRTDAGEQYRAYSSDRGNTWSEFTPMGLASPRSPASIERIPATGDLLAVWNDHSQLPLAERKHRTPFCYAISSDDGESWSESQVIAGDPLGWYCYTAIEFIGDHVLLGHGDGRRAPAQHLATSSIRRISLKSLYRRAGLARLVNVARIWDQSKHNAFTDLLRFDKQWFCVFREGTAHVSLDGALRVIKSKDGQHWTSAARITSDTADLRDAKLTITPDNRLMLSGAGAQHDTSHYKHQSLSWFSNDGTKWSDAHPIGEKDNWLWRTTWRAGVAYGVGYTTHNSPEQLVKLFHSRDGMSFDVLVDRLFTTGYPNESSLVFEPTGKCYCFLRRDAGSKTGQLGTALPPYSDWQWRDLGVRIGGPHLLRLPDGRLIAAVRLYDQRVRTSLCWLDPVNDQLTEFLTLPSGGDTSYAGLVWYDDQLWVSYYSAHEACEQFTTAIYFAQVDLY